MLQTVKAVIDKQGRISLKEKVNVEKPRTVLVTILDDEITADNESVVGSIEIVGDDLESGSWEIAAGFLKSLNENDANL